MNALPDPVDNHSLTQGPCFARRTLSSLRWRNFRLLFIGQTISQTGNWLTNVALTSSSCTATEAGWLLACWWRAGTARSC